MRHYMEMVVWVLLCNDAINLRNIEVEDEQMIEKCRDLSNQSYFAVNKTRK